MALAVLVINRLLLFSVWRLTPVVPAPVLVVLDLLQWLRSHWLALAVIYTPALFLGDLAMLARRVRFGALLRAWAIAAAPLCTIWIPVAAIGLATLLASLDSGALQSWRLAAVLSFPLWMFAVAVAWFVWRWHTFGWVTPGERARARAVALLGPVVTGCLLRGAGLVLGLIR